jgi:hypothetical protein
MPTAHDRIRRQTASQPDDSQRLASLAALLAANPTLNPTTAIRSLGVSRPADIRRLRTKFRIDQGKLLASARRPARRNGTATAPTTGAAVNDPVASKPEPVLAAPRPEPQAPPASPHPLFAQWFDLGFGALSAAVEAQSAITQCWLHLPPVSTTLRAQLVFGQVGGAIYARNKKRPFLH